LTSEYKALLIEKNTDTNLDRYTKQTSSAHLFPGKPLPEAPQGGRTYSSHSARMPSTVGPVLSFFFFSKTLSQKIPSQKRAGRVAQGTDTEFKPQCHKKK
jgi:hypothetical protein